MNVLFSLIKSLSGDEVRFINGALSAKLTAYEEDRVMRKLFALAISDSHVMDHSDEKLSQLIYSDKKNAAISKLKSRLFHFILDQLSSDQLIGKETVFDSADRQVIRIRKKMLQFRILYRKMNRADTNVLYHLLNEILKGAKEYEQFDVMTEALYFKKYLTMMRKGFDEVKSIKAQIAFYDQAYRAVLNANDRYFDLITSQGQARRARPAEAQPELREAIEELERDIESTSSIVIRYVHKMLCLEELILSKNYDRTLDTCFTVLQLMDQNPILLRKERMGFIHDNISQCFVYKEDFGNALINARKARTYYQANSLSHILSLQQEFFAFFYSHELKEAEHVVDTMLAFELITKGEFRHDKFLFLKACTLFKMGNAKESLAICNQVLKITRDKGRWDLGVRYLRLMCLMSAGEYDMVLCSVEALRKHIIRLKESGTGEGLQRDELICKALSELANSGFRNPASAKLEELLNALSQSNSITSWNYYTHEIIPVHSWIRSFLTKQVSISENKPLPVKAGMPRQQRNARRA